MVYPDPGRRHLRVVVAHGVECDVAGGGEPTPTPPVTVAAGSVPYTVTYCTAAGTGCTATAGTQLRPSAGTRTTPYLELATPGYGEHGDRG